MWSTAACASPLQKPDGWKADIHYLVLYTKRGNPCLLSVVSAVARSEALSPECPLWCGFPNCRRRQCPGLGFTKDQRWMNEINIKGGSAEIWIDRKGQMRVWGHAVSCPLWGFCGAGTGAVCHPQLTWSDKALLRPAGTLDGPRILETDTCGLGCRNHRPPLPLSLPLHQGMKGEKENMK